MVEPRAFTPTILPFRSSTFVMPESLRTQKDEPAQPGTSVENCWPITDSLSFAVVVAIAMAWGESPASSSSPAASACIAGPEPATKIGSTT